ncbi:nucleotidyltransferase domain-containing protein [Metapseudomonas otitidis]|uniref:nucleotidyltransferase domain-containing protein n=1 Tax=Metapseudomonas otitidis TaxID=319939 RepID=UPI0013F5DCD2|nr:nucleotidyltransferase domain-containing protein [Pseudomonas otitidis]
MNLLDTLFGLQRQRVLSWLLLHPEQALHVRELARITDTHPGSLHRELARLAEAGLLLRSQQGNQVLYQANRQCPVFEELAGLFRKTSGVVDVLRAALAPLSASIEYAFVFGSVARGEEQAHSDVDVLVIGSAGFVDLVRALNPCQAQLGREVNPVLYGVQEFQRKLAEGELFIRELVSRPRLFIQGVEDDFGEFAGLAASAASNP